MRYTIENESNERYSWERGQREVDLRMRAKRGGSKNESKERYG